MIDDNKMHHPTSENTHMLASMRTHQTSNYFNNKYKPSNKSSEMGEIMYHNESKRVPSFYNRTAPDTYENNKNLEKLSTHSNGIHIGFKQDGLNKKNFFDGKLPGHRFSDYEKAKIGNEIMERKSSRKNSKRNKHYK